MPEPTISELKKQLKAMEKELVAANSKLRNTEVKLEAGKVAGEELRKELERLRASNLELTKKVGSLEAKVERLPILEEELKQTRQQLVEALQQREAAIAAAVQEATREFEAQRTAWSQERTQLTEQLTTLQAEIERLRDQISKGAAEATTATPEDLATHFSQLIEDNQTRAATRTDRPVVGTMSTFEVELKGIVQAEKDTKITRIVLPGAGQVDPNQLSTLRMSFRTIPTLRPKPPKGDT